MPSNRLDYLRTTLEQARRSWFLFLRFSERYGFAVLALVASVVIGWTVASGVSDYTHGGWEIHFIQRDVGINLHFHHWYYGIPLYLIAFAIIRWNATVSIFLFGLGETLAAHSFVNEHGIPSIFEGGPTWRVSPEVYFPVVTALTLLYAFFLVRREEWLARVRDREEIATSYLCRRDRTDAVLTTLRKWAALFLDHHKEYVDSDTNIRYGHWHGPDRERDGEWQLRYTVAPFDERLDLVVIHLEHVPIQGRAGQLDNWIVDLDALLKPLAQPAVGGPQAALQLPATVGEQ